MNPTMESKIGVVSFSYIHLDSIRILGEVLSSSSGDLIKHLHDRYILTSQDDNEFHHDCPMVELLKKDIDSSRQLVQDYYQGLINDHGKELVDLLIIEDEKFLQDKILDALNFAMDKIYKSNTIRVEFLKYIRSPSKISSIPNLIYSTIGENFDIIDQCLWGQQNYIIINRRNSL